jgi:hypothetical protein
MIGGIPNMAQNQKSPAEEKFAKGITARKKFTEGSVVLEPGQSASLPLGMYDGAAPEPVFDITYDPETEEGSINKAFDRFDFYNRTPCYLLYYMFHSSSDRQCKVTVRLKNVSSENETEGES